MSKSSTGLTDSDESNECSPGSIAKIALGEQEQFLAVPDETASTDWPIIATLKCPAGQIITAIGYKGVATGNDSDATDGLTVRCSILNSDGTLTVAGQYLSNPEIDNNPNMLGELICPPGSVYDRVNTKDLPVAPGINNDLTDGFTTGCTNISAYGLSGMVTPQANTDIDTNPRVLTGTACPIGYVLTGIAYDQAVTLASNPDAMDGYNIYCKPLITSCDLVPQCSNGIDDDGDGLVDMQDPGCTSENGNNEGSATTACQDGLDNDGDGLVDLSDPGCSSPTDDDESDGTSACQDGLDNDGDGLIDMIDPGCTEPVDNEEGGINRPENLKASDGTDPNGIYITWNAIPTASSYTLYRSTEFLSQGSVLAANLPASNFYDTSAKPETIYYYRAIATVGGVMTLPSDADAGNLQPLNLTCKEVNISQLISATTEEMFTLRDIARRALQVLRTSAKGTKSYKKTAKYVTSQLKMLDFRYQSNLQLFAVYPPIVVVDCANVTVCSSQDNTAVIQSNAKLADDMSAIALTAIQKTKKYRKLNGTDKKRIKRTNQTDATIDGYLKSLPLVTNTCS